MPKLLTVIAITAAIVLVAASASMNFLFASSLGRTALEGSILGAVAVGVDMLKAVLAIFLGYAARQQRWLFVAIGSAAFVLFSTLSLAAAFGFTATNRQAAIAGHERGNQRLAELERRIGELQSKLRGLPTHRILALVDAEFDAKRVDARWLTSRECAALTTARVREFCEGIALLRSERIAAVESARLEQLISEHETEIGELRKAGGDVAADPQARSMAQVLGLSELEVRRGLSALLALVVEVGSALGVYIALGHGIQMQRDARPDTASRATALTSDETKPDHRSLAEAPVVPDVSRCEVSQQATHEQGPSADCASSEAARPGVAVSVRHRRSPRATPIRGSNGSG